MLSSLSDHNFKFFINAVFINYVIKILAHGVAHRALSKNNF